jgi:hypothetical protein
MVCQPLRLALLIGAITAVAVSPVQASFWAPRCSSPCESSPCAGTTAPAFRTVTCTEWVRENVTTTRKAYKTECRTETYDTCRTECVPVCREKVVCVKTRVPVMKEECRKVCHKVTVWEDRVVNKTTYKHVQETCMKKTLVRMGHWECREVTPLFSGFGNGGLFGGLGHGCGHRGACGDACGAPCASNACDNACNNACRPTRTKKVWVSCPEYKECPVTVCKKVAVCQAVTCKVAVCKNEWREQMVKVCTYQCVEEKRVVKYTAYETRKVACKATRTVRVCVPYDETVTCCKLVPKTVTRQVACAAPCASTCNTACNNACTSNACCERGGWLRGIRERLRHNGDCCRTSCGSSCN